MNKLYKGRYLIAVYLTEDDEELVGFCDNTAGLNKILGLKQAQSAMSRYIRTMDTFPIIRTDKYTFYFIDTKEKHKDCFSYEDRLFNEYIEKEPCGTAKEFCERHNLSMRTYFRNKQVFANREEDIRTL